MINENITYGKMVFNRVTLAFPKDQEILFQKKYFTSSIFQFRIAFFVIMILFGVFGYLDSQIVPQFAKLFQSVRFFIVVPLFLIVILLSFTRYFSRIWQVLLFICYIISGLAIIFMITLAPDNYTYYLGLILIFIAGYFFIKLRFFLASIAGWITLLFFNIGSLYFAEFDGILIVSFNFFYASANIIGMVAAYNIEFYMRRDFYLNQELDSQKAVVDDINKNLEKIVDERTKEMVDAKNRAEKSDRLKSAFLANVSHEIRTPMNGILGFANLLKEDKLKGETQQEYIRIIERSGLRMLSIINTIIDISKIESGLMEININSLDINEQVKDIYTFFKPDVEQRGIQFNFKNSLPSQNSIIKTDREKLFAILTNLVGNAVKNTNSGKIEFGYEVEGDFIKFFVKDTGFGIPKEMNQAIFERFIQTEVSTKKAIQGAGLGLSIAKAYAEMLGGKIWVESEEDKGAAFYFTIQYKPGYINDNIPKGIKLEQTTENHGETLKVLIAEDDDTSDLMITIMLKKISHEVLHAKTGTEAVEISVKNPDIDLILMDIRMPEMDGYEAIRQIRKFNKEVIIIAQTAYGLDGDSEKAIDAGSNDHIAKPILKDALLKLIKKHFRK